MPSFDFSISPKKESKKKAIKNNVGFKVILSNATGVVWIDNKANYSVSIDNVHVSIHKDCYSCKGQLKVYRQGTNSKGRVCYIRCLDDCKALDTNYWLPFAPGCIVIGDLYSNEFTFKKYFIIKKCFIDLSNQEAHDAMQYYREHLIEINNIINNRNV